MLDEFRKAVEKGKGVSSKTVTDRDIEAALAESSSCRKKPSKITPEEASQTPNARETANMPGGFVAKALDESDIDLGRED